MTAIDDRRARALAAHRSGNLIDAERQYRELLDQSPEDAETWHLLAVLCGQSDRPADVVRCCREAIRHGYRSAALYANLGAAHLENGAAESARAAFRESLSIDPTDADLTLEYVSLLGEAGLERDALRWIDAACSRFPLDARMHTEYGQLAAALNDGQLAEESFRHAVRLQRDHADSWLNLGSILLMRGDVEGAEYAYRKSLDIDPEGALACWYLSQIIGPDDDPAFAERVFARAASVTCAKSAPILFAAAKMKHSAGQADDAFTAWTRGNRLIRRTYNYAVDADVAALKRLGEELRRTRAAPGAPDGAERAAEPVPIFIAGMPRSGSTLIEQMLARHPAVDSGGEIVWFQRYVHRALKEVGRNYPADQQTLNESALAVIGQRYSEAIAQRSRGARFITDKLPGNFACIPTIRKLFPNALIIHARRDGLETCWSCFRHLFSGTQRFAYDLEEVGRYCVAVHEFVGQCRKQWPDHVLEVRYEALVDDPEPPLRRILHRLDLDWFAGCLRPEASSQLIQTASGLQVRAGLAETAFKHASSYAAHLQPLREALQRGTGAAPAIRTGRQP